MTFTPIEACAIDALALKFQVDQSAGSGQSARSYFGRMRQSGISAHIKLLVAPRSRLEIARFEGEAFILAQYARYENPCVPLLLSSGSVLQGDVHYIATRRASGQPLSAWLANGCETARPEERLEIFHRVASALSRCVHFNHRDLHPDNVMLLDGEPDWHDTLPDPLAMILDWGQAYTPLLAGFDDSPAFSLILHERVPKELIGSFYSLPPDVFVPQSDAVANPGKHDAWSLGLLLHRILCGRTLLRFQGIGDYVEAIHSGKLRQTLNQAAAEIGASPYPSANILALLFERLTAILPQDRAGAATAARVLWDIRMEDFAIADDDIARQYIQDPNNFKPPGGWKYSVFPDYD